MDRRPEDADFLAFRDTGSPDALARVFDVLAPRLLLLAGHVTRDAALAEDLVQTTFLQAMRDAQGYDGARPVATWLGGILRHRALDLRRRGVLREVQDLPRDLAGAVDPAALVGDKELFDEALAAVEALPDPYREVLLLRLVHGLTPAAIAHTLGRAPGTVRMQLQRGTERLRRALPDRRELVGALLLVPVRGLAGLRQAVLAKAGVGSQAAKTLTILGGIGMSKILLAVAVLLAVLSLLFFPDLLRTEPAPLAGDGGAQAATPRETVATAGTPELDEGQAGVARRVAAPSAAAAAAPVDGGLTVSVRLAVSGVAATDVGVYVRPVAGGLGTELRTDGSGQARFPDLAPGVVLVHVDRDPALTRVDLRRENEVTLLIQTGTTLRGRVIDLEEEGVADARVYRINDGHHDVLQRVATSDDEGFFSVRGLAEDVDLIARAAGYQPSEVEHARDEEIELQLGGLGGSLTGQVLDAAGEGVAYAWIVVGVDEDARDDPAGSTAVPDDGSHGKNMDREGILLRADQQGRFASDEIPGGNVVVIARSSDGLGAGVAWETVWMVAGEAQDVKLHLHPGAEVVGVVRDGSGRPMGGFELEAEWEGTPALGQMEDKIGHYVSDRRVISAADGSFTLDGLLPGDYDLRVFGERHELLQDQRVLDAGERFTWEPVISARGSLDVTLLDPAGQPIEGWAVDADERFGRFPGWGAFREMTDADGKLRLADLVDGAEHEISVYPVPTSHRIPVARRLVTITGSTRLELRLAPAEQPTCVITGSLADRAHSIELARPGWDEKVGLLVDPSGRFRMKSLSAGEVVISTRAGTRLGAWTLAAGEELEVGTLRVPSDD